jgi:hypothetical protein
VINDRNPLEAALAGITLQLTGASGQGTGFFVAPGLVLTCAHVLCGPGESPPERVSARWEDLDLELEFVARWYLPKDDGGPDLALLQIRADLEHSHAVMSAAVQPGDELWTYGYPEGPYRAGDSAVLRYDGRSRRTDGAELLRVTQGRVSAGFSGSPVLNWRTGGVCGLLRLAERQPGAVGGARLVPASVVLDSYPDVAEVSGHPHVRSGWIGLLGDEQLRAGGWRYPGPALRGYLEAARRAAREHPYSVALPNAPSLATVYLRQQLAVSAEEDKERERQRTSRAEPGPSQRTAVPAAQSLSIEEALLRHRCALVLGGPGAGKSSLLRHVTDLAATCWLDADEQRYVPVRISADALAGNHPFPDIITASVMEDLGATIGELPKTLFASEALPGVPWLVLVDGLDEITSHEMRYKATRVLIHWWNHSAYRFLVASRQLPEDQLASLRTVASVFTIEPFASGQLPDLATSWFAALKVDDVAGTTERFLDHLKRSRLGEIATTPLIATLACVVFAGCQAVPPGRFGLYNGFVTRLLEDPRKRENLLQHLEGQARPYAAEDSIRKLVQDRRSLLERYAYIRQLGAESASSTKSLQELFSEWTRRYKPDGISIPRWNELIIETARQSGLVVQRGDDFVFFHQTIQEYLSACYQAATFRPSRRRATKELSLRASGVWDGEWDDIPTPQLFLAAAWMNSTGRLPRPMPTIHPYHRVVFGMFLGALARDGVSLPGSSAKRAIGQLTRLAGVPWWARWWMRAVKAARLQNRWPVRFGWRYNRIVAAKGLVRLDREQGIAALAALAADSSLTANRADDVRIDAARTLASLDQTRGADALAALAADTKFGYGYRPGAVQQLAEIDPERARQTLVGLTTDPAISDWDRQNAAIDLNWLNNDYDMIALASMATECTVAGYARARAAATLAKQGSELAVETLAAYMADSTVDSWDRADAAEALSAIAPEPAAEILAALAIDPTARSYPRLVAARLLSQIDVERGAQALAAIASDLKADSDDRRQAAGDLADLDRPRGIQKLVDLASDPSMKRGERRRARRAAWKRRRQRDTS